MDTFFAQLPPFAKNASNTLFILLPYSKDVLTFSLLLLSLLHLCCSVLHANGASSQKRSEKERKSEKKK